MIVFLIINVAKVTREVRKYFELNENVKTTYQNFKDIAKAVLRGKCIGLSANNTKENRFQTINFLLKKLNKKNKLNQKQTEYNKNKIKNK